jgi:acetyltransferase-like isoleucine patch superfamily enzyme
VVLRDLPAGVLAVGSPARIVRSLIASDQAAPTAT